MPAIVYAANSFIYRTNTAVSREPFVFAERRTGATQLEPDKLALNLLQLLEGNADNRLPSLSADSSIFSE